MPARAAFHLWKIDEVYTNASGTLQFIELTDTSGGQNFVSGKSNRHRFSILLHSERFRVAQQLQGMDLAREALGDWIKWDPKNPKLKQISEALQAAR